jgi:hypothetical protein
LHHYFYRYRIDAEPQPTCLLLCCMHATEARKEWGETFLAIV